MTEKTIKFEKRERALEVAEPARLEILKTYKLFIDGKFPRTESGRYFVLKDSSGKDLANVNWSSRKDLRDAVTAARNAQSKWANATAYLRGQILYRIAEVLESRREEFMREIILQGSNEAAANLEVSESIDRLVYFAGWSDKYQQIFSSVNPVASSHFNFSRMEPVGVVGIVAPNSTTLLGLVSVIAPVIVGGNSVLLLASEQKPLSAITFGEVLHSSDLPAGVVNILTGYRKELLSHLSSHMDIQSVLGCGLSDEEFAVVQRGALSNLKRCLRWTEAPETIEFESPYRISEFQEVKTTWHPVGI